MIISKKKYEEAFAKAKEEAACKATRETEERVWNDERFRGLRSRLTAWVRRSTGWPRRSTGRADASAACSGGM